VRRGAVRLTQGGTQEIVLPRSAIPLAPGGSGRPEARNRKGTEVLISAGGGAETAQTAFRRSLMDPDLLGESADGIMVMFRDASAFRVVRMPQPAFDEAWSLMKRIEAEGERGRPGRELMQRLVLAELLMTVNRCFQETEEKLHAGPARFRIREAEAHIRDRYAEDISLPALAAHFGFNPSYFSRLFAGHTGMHLIEYLNRVRVQKACVFLKRSAMSIVEIAFSVGYNNLSHFNRYFKRIMGMSPREYRNKSKK
jgi:YesN/AraC family two-component response regulator